MPPLPPRHALTSMQDAACPAAKCCHNIHQGPLLYVKGRPAADAPHRAKQVSGSSVSPSSSGASSPPRGGAPRATVNPAAPGAAAAVAEGEDSPCVARSEPSVDNATAAVGNATAGAAAAAAAKPGIGSRKAGWDVELGVTRASKKSGRPLLGSAKVLPLVRPPRQGFWILPPSQALRCAGYAEPAPDPASTGVKCCAALYCLSESGVTPGVHTGRGIAAT